MINRLHKSIKTNEFVANAVSIFLNGGIIYILAFISSVIVARALGPTGQGSVSIAVTVCGPVQFKPFHGPFNIMLLDLALYPNTREYNCVVLPLRFVFCVGRSFSFSHLYHLDWVDVIVTDSYFCQNYLFAIVVY